MAAAVFLLHFHVRLKDKRERLPERVQRSQL